MIIYLDNDPNDLFFMDRALKRIGYTESFFPCQSPGEFYQACGRYRDAIGAILIDYKLDCIRGTEILNWIKAQPKLKGVQCFMISAGRFGNEIECALESGALAYVFKPRGAAGWDSIAEAVVDAVTSASRESV